MAWKHRGVEITVTGEGLFRAKVQDFTVEGNSLDQCRKAIDEALKANIPTLKLPVVGITESRYSGYYGDEDERVVGKIVSATLVAVNRTTGDFTFLGFDSKDDNLVLRHILADTPANRNLLERFVVARRLRDSLDEAIQEREIHSARGRIQLGQYARVLENIKTAHETSTTKSEATE